MTVNKIYDTLYDMENTIDEIRESKFVQDHNELMEELEEIFGHIENVLDIIAELTEEREEE